MSSNSDSLSSPVASFLFVLATNGIWKSSFKELKGNSPASEVVSIEYQFPDLTVIST